tara:strand:+ start:269 stop:445 length:177 start_codon:yes stop_codon:yes gene_type:complete
MSDRKIIEYQIVCDQTTMHAELVMEYFTNGWELYGQPFAIVENNLAFFCQGMVKYDGE